MAEISAKYRNLKGAVKYIIWIRKNRIVSNLNIAIPNPLKNIIFLKCRRFLNLAEIFSLFGLTRPGNSGEEDDFKQIACCRSILEKQFNFIRLKIISLGSSIYFATRAGCASSK